MSSLVDHDICNSSVPHAQTSFAIVSGLAAVSGFLFALHEL